jgi:hypothetical protein
MLFTCISSLIPRSEQQDLIGNRLVNGIEGIVDGHNCWYAKAAMYLLKFKEKVQLISIRYYPFNSRISPLMAYPYTHYKSSGRILEPAIVDPSSI